MPNLEHFFTTREIVIKSAEPEMENLITKNKEVIKKYLNVKLKNNSFEFIPYKVVRTNDELYNYYNVKIRIPEEGIYWYCFEFISRSFRSCW